MIELFYGKPIAAGSRAKSRGKYPRIQSPKYPTPESPQDETIPRTTSELAGPGAIPRDETVWQFLNATRDLRTVITDAQAIYCGIPLKPRSLVPDKSRSRPCWRAARFFLPMHNPDGEVARLRRRVAELLRANEPLFRGLTERGFNVPGIIHSRVLRFVQPPADLEGFLTRFDQIAVETKFPPLEVKEIILTSEMKPYMRGGEVVGQFKLAGA